MPAPAYRATTLRRRYPGEHLIRFRRDVLGAFERMAATGGDLVQVRVGPRRVVLVRHPDLAREVLIDRHAAFTKSRALRLSKFLLGEGLLTSEDAFHQRQRKLVLPAFHHTRLRSYGTAMVRLTEEHVAGWTEAEPVALDREMMRLTLRIAARTLFAADVDDERGEIYRALTASLGVARRVSNPLAEWFLRLPLPSTRRLERARDRLDALVLGLIDDRRRDGADHGDLLSMLLAAQDEDTGRGMTDRQVRDEVMTLFLAGHETTAQALAWTGYLLARHPDVQARLHAEVDAALGGRPASFDDLARLGYARQVLAEAMRLYPPAYAIGRESREPVEVGGTPLPAGTTVLIGTITMHHDPRFWPAPERFDPDRFAPGASADRPRFAYLPFSTGRRGCIGEQFAWAEGVLVLATLAQRWRLHPAADRHPGLDPSMTLRPRRRVALRLERHP
ncbi:MAG: cytochrome P450 [Rhodothermales bacterium]|nr:cytochrome P450 [Rhodothermales bacterium]